MEGTGNSSGAVSAAARPARAVIRDDGRRSRLTVFFRLLLALPHLVVLWLWSLLAFVLAVVSWFSILFTGRPVAAELQARFVRYNTHVLAYLTLAGEPFPAFGGDESYPIDVELARPPAQSRWKTLLRLPLALPALLLAGALASFQLTGQVETGPGETQSTWQLNLGIVGVAAILGWFAALARGAMPAGLRDVLAYAIGYLAQVWSYLLLVTDRYPTSDPLYITYPEAQRDHPVRIRVEDDLRRSRLTVFFRFLLWLPHLVWLLLWGVVVAFAVFFNWFVALFAGRPAAGLHRFTARYVRYFTHTTAFLYLVANPFPGFGGEPGTYPVDLELPEPAPQSRWKTGFRLVLAIPAWMVSSALGTAFGVVAVFGWFTGLFLGRMPQGLRNLGAFCLRYSAQTAAYSGLLTDRYPFASPGLEAPATTAVAPAPE